MSSRPILRPSETLAACFGLIGIGHVAALWFSMYRLATLALIVGILITQLSASARSVDSPGMRHALLRAAPIYLYALVSTSWSPQPADAFINTLYVLAAVAPAIALGATLAHRYKGVHIAQGFGVLLVPFAAQAVVSAIQGRSPMEVGDGTMRSLLSSAICLASPILAGAWAITRQARFLVFGLVVAAFAVTMESRSVVLFAGPAVMVSLYLHDEKLAKRVLTRSVLPLLCVLAIAGPSMVARFDSSSTSFDIGEAIVEEFSLPADERVDFDRRLTTFTSLQTFLEYPVFGRGYSAIFQLHRSEYGIELSAHGLAPGTLSELGIVGLLIIAAVVWRVIRVAVQSAKSGKADPMSIHFVVGMGAILVLGLFHQTIESVFFGMGFGLLVGLGRFPKTARVAKRRSGPLQPVNIRR
jgi:hypothetical protein